MKPNLPESRNRNLPPPPAAAAEVRSRRFTAQPEEPRRGPVILRSFLAMLLVGGLLAGGIWFYIRGAESDVKVREEIEASLKRVAVELWANGNSFSLSADTDEARADLADLPRVVLAVRGAAQRVLPDIRILEGDPPPGNGKASHQILFIIHDRTVLVIRVWYERGNGQFKFVGEANRVVPSRKDLKEPVAAPPASAAPTPTTPQTPPAAPSSPVPPNAAPEASVPAPAVPQASPSPGPAAEKVSEPP